MVSIQERFLIKVGYTGKGTVYKDWNIENIENIEPFFYAKKECYWEENIIRISSTGFLVITP